MLLLQILLLNIFVLRNGYTLNTTSLGCVRSTCYWLINYGSNVLWHEAGNLCQQFNNAKLVSIPDEETNVHLVRNLLPFGLYPPFLGALVKTFPWRWVTGESFDGNVLKITVNPECDRQQGAALQLVQNGGGKSQRIMALDCLEKRRYMCKIKDLPSTSENIFLSLSDGNWYQARYACSVRGMELLTFPDSNLQQISSILDTKLGFSLANKTEVWIGLYSETWIWTDNGKEIIYSNIDRGCEKKSLRLEVDGRWSPMGSCCGPVICQLPEGVATESNPEDVAGKSDVSLLERVLIPVVCVIGGCIVGVAVAFVVWKKTRPGNLGKETTGVTPTLGSNTDREQHSNRYDNEKELPNQGSHHSYLELDDNPGYETISSTGSVHHYEIPVK